MIDDLTTSEDVSGAEATTESVTEAPSWNWDENTVGTGDRPDYLAEKFKSVADAAKSYNSLEKKLGTAPKEYDFSLSKSWLDPDFEPLKEAAQFAKEKHVSQDVMNQILGAATMYLEENTVKTTDEIAKLGANANERLTLINNWAKSNFTESTFNALTSSMDTAESVVAMEEIRNKMLNNITAIPSSNDSNTNSAQSLAEVQGELNNNLAKYKSDPKYRKEISAKLEAASSNSSFTDK